MNIFSYIKENKLTIRYTKNGEEIELLKVDATPSEDHRLNARLTRHNIEDGGTITDHVIKEPRTLSFTGIISDDPIDIGSVSYWTGNLLGIVSSAVGKKALSYAASAYSFIDSNLMSSTGKRSKTALEALDGLYEYSIPVSITTGLRTYSNMILESLNINRNVQNARGLEFTASFVEASFATSEIVEVPISQINNAVKHTATKTKNKGKLVKKDATTEQKAAGSWAYRLIDFGVKVLGF